MFEILLKLGLSCCIIVSGNFEHVFLQMGGAMDYIIYMKELKMMIEKLDENDSKIITQLYTILLKYLEKRGRL